MFLAIKEIRHEKLRYGLIIAMVTLVAYLVFMLLGLMLGLANENTAATTSWRTQTVVLNKNANVNINQSLITKAALPKLKSGDSLVGQSSVVISDLSGKHSYKKTAQFIGLDKSQSIYRHLDLVSGHKPRNANQVVLATNLKLAGYKLGDQIKLAGLNRKLTVVGFAKNGMLNMTPIIYGDLQVWREMKGSQFAGSAIFSRRSFTLSTTTLKAYPVATYVNKMPGYSAQNQTFALMIGFLLVIATVIIAVFLYILTLQKLPHYAVLRAQGIPAKVLVQATISQAVLLMVVGGALSLALTGMTSLVLPATMPFLFSWPTALGLTAAMIVLGTLGALIPVGMIQHLQPLDALH